MNEVDYLWGFIVRTGIATDEELKLVTDVAGYSERILNNVIYARTGYRGYEQLVELDSDFFEPVAELDDFYMVNR